LFLNLPHWFQLLLSSLFFRDDRELEGAREKESGRERERERERVRERKRVDERERVERRERQREIVGRRAGKKNSKSE
jgi:hypothetical protein